MGELYVITGPMFSGKTEALQRHIRRFQLSGKRCLIINHASDTRYGEDAQCCTHYLQRMPAIVANRLETVLDQCQIFDVIAIDEGQFYPDLIEFVDHLTNDLNKIVVVSALDGTYEGKPFGRVGELLARAEHFEKLSAVCLRCGRDAAFTVRKKEYHNVKDTVSIGASEQYEAVCRACRRNM
jgi:thymidine kinase